MNLFRLLKGGRRYKRKLEKRFSQEIGRRQLNFACDERLILLLKLLAKELEVPIYTLAEHLLQLGGAEVAILMKDEALRNQLCHHLAFRTPRLNTWLALSLVNASLAILR